jgi:Na+/melibiose symporter-like transporter
MGRGEILLGLIIGVFTTIFIINDAKKRGMSQAWGAIGFFLGLIGLIIYLIARKPILQVPASNQFYGQTESSINFQNSIQDLKIPDSCPHCKNPNTKKIRLCEWCGNQII